MRIIPMVSVVFLAPYEGCSVTVKGLMIFKTVNLVTMQEERERRGRGKLGAGYQGY